MNLYLSSYRIGNSGERLAKWAAGRKALVVSNALDFSEDAERLKFGREREMGWLADLGIDSEPLDLRDYAAAHDRLVQHVRDAGMLWVVGGNTFLLRMAMAISGMDQLLLDLVADKDFVYAGYSAGVCVLSPSLKGIHLADEPEAKPIGYEHHVLWDGLGILDDYIVPHYRSDHFESHLMEAVVTYYREHGLPYTTLADGDVILRSTADRS